MGRRRGRSIEPTGTGARVQTMGDVNVVTGLQGALPPHRSRRHGATEWFIRVPGSQVFEDVVRKPYVSSKVNSCYLVRRLEDDASLTDFGEGKDSFIARKPDPRFGPGAGPRCEVASSSPSASVIPSAPALE
jgi:hypothetical protein